MPIVYEKDVKDQARTNAVDFVNRHPMMFAEDKDFWIEKLTELQIDLCELKSVPKF